MSGIGEKIGVDIALSGGKELLKHLFPGRIEITSPRSGEFLEDKQPLGRVFSYGVRGTLKRLPPNHEIWLLTEDRNGYVRPQGFSLVLYPYPKKGQWAGRVHAINSQVKIIAVVAPPTSQEFFKYFQKVGDKTNYEPLTHVPVECKNRAFVQARLPTING